MSGLTQRDIWLLQQAFAAGRALAISYSTNNHDACCAWLDSSMFTDRDMPMRDVLAADAPAHGMRP